MMDEIEVKNIKEAGNPRKDLGNIAELAASIREIGLVEPMVGYLEGKTICLTAGSRRLAAIRLNKMEKIPSEWMKIRSKDDAFEVSMTENIQRKDLTPLEEAAAYMTHMTKTKMTAEQLAKKLGKTKGYVNRRIRLLFLVPEAQKALDEGKIELGHAVVLSAIADKKAQKEELEDLLSDTPRVSDFADMLRNYGRSDNIFQLSHACFNKKDCDGCINNGGQQAILNETGANLKGICLSSSCYVAKTNEWKEQQAKTLRAKGITVLDSLEGQRRLEKIREYEPDYKEIVTKRLEKEPKNFAVYFNNEYGKMVRDVYCIQPMNREKPKEGEKQKDPEEVLNLSRGEKLDRRVSYYKRQLLVDTTRKLMREDLKGKVREAKAFAAFKLLDLAGYDCDTAEELERIAKLEGFKLPKTDLAPGLPEMLKLDEKALDAIILRIPAEWVDALDQDDLELAADAFGFDIQKHFILTKEYLEMYTIDQLQALVKELGLKVEGQKKGELVQAILKADTKGKVPKIMQKAKPADSIDY
ncbi:MAG: ParB/RepB/Spo0J family partition protein [Candidatus Micrarchaeota archaeon]|nr:ParB/RepB/Spo0J family partition protein [Candidatus Micrarchaeota archaeon]